MTEAEWFTETDFTRHTGFVESRLSPRKQRLLAVAFCRVVWHLLEHPDLRAAVDLAEAFADGANTPEEMHKASERCRVLAVKEYDAYTKAVDRGATDGTALARHELAWAVACAAAGPVSVQAVAARLGAAAHAGAGHETDFPVLSLGRGLRLAREHLAGEFRSLVWEVTGNPFAPVEFDPAWRTSTATAVANQIYASRDFSAMPILADALQDAGCDNESVLNHLRDEAPVERGGLLAPRTTHTRGCWALDIVLSKS